MTILSEGATRRVRNQAPASRIPRLILPKNKAILDNGCENRKDGVVWEFTWSNVNKAERYHLYVMGKNAQFPVIDNSAILKTSYKDDSPETYIADVHRYGWKWKVRAMVNGVWGKW